jgi:1,4-dihydroxy-6-naphthoate synthase
VLARTPFTPGDLAGRRIAVPGADTTAYVLLRLYVPVPFTPVMMDFERVMDAVESGEVDAGVVIHEGQLTWTSTQLCRVIDLGAAWSDDTGLPIPLGLDVVRRGMGETTMAAVARALKDSIVYARLHEDEAIDYAMGFGRGVARETCRTFVRMYVNEDTVDMGDEGRRALETLYARAVGRGILAETPRLDILQV